MKTIIFTLGFFCSFSLFAQNVGIGTTSPDTRLHLNGVENNGTTATLKITSGSQNMLLDGNEIDSYAGLFLNNNSSGDVNLANGGGNVGIHTVKNYVGLNVRNPSASNALILNVEDSDGIDRFGVGENGNAGFNHAYINVGLNLRNPSAYNARVFQVENANGNKLFEVHENGNISIGTSGPNARLDINAPGGQPSIVTRGGFDYATATGQYMSFGHWDGSTYDERFTITPNGNIKAPGISFGDHSNMQYRTSDGTFFYDNSSRRFKENIQPLEDDFYLILKAQPKTYTRPHDSCRWEVGYIAEEMDSLGLEKLVSYDSLGTPDGFNYEKMILYVNEILKEHHSEIALLKTQNTQLTTVVSEMKTGLLFLKYLLLGLFACAGLFLLFKIRKSFSIPMVYTKEKPLSITQKIISEPLSSLKTFFLILLFCTNFISQKSQAQVHLQSGATLTTTNNVQITMDNISFENNGTFDGSNSTVTIQESNGSANLTFGGSGTTTLNHLNIDLQTQDILLTGAVTVDGDLIFLDGLLDLNGNDVTLGASGIILGETESSSFIGSNGGEVVKTVDLVASITTNPGNIGAEITPDINMTNTTIRRGHVPQTEGDNAGISRYYNISSTVSDELNGTFRFHYLDTELVGILEDELELWRNDGSGWTYQGFTSRSEEFNYVELTGTEVFSNWTATNEANALPVELISFNARVDDRKNVQLDWITAVEINNDFFSIERSSDALKFEAIGQISGQGNSNSLFRYTFVDEQPIPGDSYYRLKQVDIDGTFSYSETRSVRILLSSVMIYPNPTHDVLNITMTDFENELVKLAVLNDNGKTIWAGEREVKEGVTVLSLPEIRLLTPGSYFLNINAGEHKPTIVKFVKVE